MNGLGGERGEGRGWADKKCEGTKKREQGRSVVEFFALCVCVK